MSPEDAKKKCLRSTRVSKSDAESLLFYHMRHPTTEYQRCFLQCYFTYSNKIVIASLRNKTEESSMKTVTWESKNTKVNYTDVSIGLKTPSSVAICIAEKKSSGSGQKCGLGDYTRTCHISFAQDVAKSLNLEIQGEIVQQLEYSLTEGTTTEDNITTTENMQPEFKTTQIPQ